MVGTLLAPGMRRTAQRRMVYNAIVRIGGVFEGVRRAHMPAYDGGIRDTAYFSILRADWPKVQRHLVALLQARRA